MQNRNFDDGWNMPSQIYDIQNYFTKELCYYEILVKVLIRNLNELSCRAIFGINHEQ